MFKIPWNLVLFSSIIVIIIFSLVSLFVNKHGTYSTINSLVSEDKYAALTEKNDLKYESKGEAILRSCLENIFNDTFPNVRLDSIVNPSTGRKLEIDCYNEKLKIGAEYHGINHYKFVPFFHKTEEAFLASKQRDEFKKIKCAELGITLLIVPYNTQHDKICEFVKRELRSYGLLDHLYGWNDSKIF
jgi:hypothetical protein